MKKILLFLRKNQFLFLFVKILNVSLFFPRKLASFQIQRSKGVTLSGTPYFSHGGKTRIPIKKKKQKTIR